MPAHAGESGNTDVMGYAERKGPTWEAEAASPSRSFRDDDGRGSVAGPIVLRLT